MAIKSLFFIFFVFSFFFPIKLHAQAIVFHIERQTRFIQRLSWTPDNYALRYEIEIEGETDGTFQRLILESTDEAWLNVSLPPGNYRYRIIPYNLLNRPGHISEWLNFEIIPALNPEINRFSPGAFYLGMESNDELTDYVLHLYGNNLISKDEMYLINFNGDTIIPVDIQLLYDGREARLYFTRDQLIAGVYQIHTKNPGGLEVNVNGFTIFDEDITPPDPHWPVQIFLGVNWFTFMDLHGENILPDQFLSGTALRFNMVSSNLSFFNIGFEITPALYSINALFNSEETTKSLLLEINFLLQKLSINRRLALTFRAGAGMILPIDGIFNKNLETTDPLESTLTYANTGLSLFFVPLKHFFIEAGTNYSYLFAIDNLSGRLRPWAGLGVRF